MAESAEPTPGPNASESREAVQNVLEELETPPALAVGDITERVDYSRRTVHSRLKDLKEDPMVDLKSAKIGGSTAYWIPEPEGTTGSGGAGFAGAATAQVATFRSWVTPAFAISPALVAWLFVSFIPTWLLAVGAASWFAGVTPTRIKDRRFGRPEKTALLWSGVATASVGFVYILLAVV